MLKQKSQITGNSGLFFVAWQLSRRGCNAMPTVRNATGSDLFVTNHDESIFFGVQSKALSKRNAVPLGLSLDKLQSDWWVITIKANEESPVCYILTLAEVRHLALQDKGGQQAYWLEPRFYDCDEFKDAWHRLDMDSNAKVRMEATET